MSATEAAATPAVAVEEVKPSEAPVTETSAPAPEAPKVEAAAAPVRLFLCVTFLCSYFFFFFFFPFQGGCEDRSRSGWSPFLLVVSVLILLSFRKVLSLHQVRNLLPRMPNPYVLFISNGSTLCLNPNF